MAQAAPPELRLTSTHPKYSSLDKFEIAHEIGKGCFSAVYRARCKEDGSHVALKTIKIKELADEKAKVDCMKEMALLEKLDHPNIIKYYASFIANDEVHIVLELADGGDLAKILKASCGKMLPVLGAWNVRLADASDVLCSTRIKGGPQVIPSESRGYHAVGCRDPGTWS